MSANLALVVHTTEADANVLTFQGRCNALSQAGLSHARRSVEAQNRASLVVAQLQHSQVFEDAFLHFLHAIMVAVQYLLCSVYLDVALRAVVPRQVDHRLQIGQLNVVVRTLGIDARELAQFFLEDGRNLLAPLLPFCFLAQLCDVFRLGRCVVAVAQFGLQVVNLLIDEVLPLLLVQVGLRLALHIQLDVSQLQDVVQDDEQLLSPFDFLVAHQELALHLDVHWQVATYQVHHERRGRHSFDEVQHLGGNVVPDASELHHAFLDEGQHRLVLGLFREGRLYVCIGGGLSDIAKPAHRHGMQFDGVQGLQQHVSGSVGSLDGMNHLRHHSGMYQVVERGLVHLWVFLAKHAYQRAFPFGLTNRAQRALAPDDNRIDGAREEDIVADGQNHHLSSLLRMHHRIDVSGYVGYKGEGPVVLTHVIYFHL